MTNAEKLDLTLSILIAKKGSQHYLGINDIIAASNGKLGEEEIRTLLLCLFKDGNIKLNALNDKAFFNHQGEAFLNEKGGYVEQENLRIKSIRQADRSFTFTSWTFWVSAAALVVALLSLIKQCS